MRRRSPYFPSLVLIGLLVLVAGFLEACGGDEGASGTASESTPQDVRENDESRAIALVSKHFRAISEGDWSRVCNTLSEVQQREVAAGTKGTCERGAAERYGTPRFKRFAVTFASITPDVTVDGDRALATFEENFVVTLVRNEEGEWRLERNASRSSSEPTLWGGVKGPTA